MTTCWCKSYTDMLAPHVIQHIKKKQTNLCFTNLHATLTSLYTEAINALDNKSK